MLGVIRSQPVRRLAMSLLQRDELSLFLHEECLVVWSLQGYC